MLLNYNLINARLSLQKLRYQTGQETRNWKLLRLWLTYIIKINEHLKSPSCTKLESLSARPSASVNPCIPISPLKLFAGFTLVLTIPRYMCLNSILGSSKMTRESDSITVGCVVTNSQASTEVYATSQYFQLYYWTDLPNLPIQQLKMLYFFSQSASLEARTLCRATSTSFIWAIWCRSLLIFCKW